MRKLTDQERQLLRAISIAGGSVCPGREITGRFSKEGRKSLRWMAGNGYLTEEETDDGPRFTLTEQGQAEVDHA